MITLQRLIGAAAQLATVGFAAVGGEAQEALLEAPLLVQPLGEIVFRQIHHPVEHQRARFLRKTFGISAATLVP